MYGIVDAGGGLRGVFSSGVYDCLMEKGIEAPYCLGVSAGSANLISYLCGQKKRTLKFYTEYAARPDFMGPVSLIRTGSLIGLDYIYSTLSNEGGEYPLDYDVFEKSASRFSVAATAAESGRSHYFEKREFSRNNYDIIKASCAIPGVCRPVEIGGKLYFDGGTYDPIPLKKAYDDGCDNVLLVLTKPRDDYAKPMSENKKKVLRPLLKRYPAVFEAVMTRHLRAEKTLELMRDMEKDGRLVVIEPESTFGMDTLTVNKNAMYKMYASGHRQTMELLENEPGFFGDDRFGRKTRG